jgi:hypothetical protein
MELRAKTTQWVAELRELLEIEAGGGGIFEVGTELGRSGVWGGAEVLAALAYGLGLEVQVVTGYPDWGGEIYGEGNGGRRLRIGYANSHYWGVRKRENFGNIGQRGSLECEEREQKKRKVMAELPVAKTEPPFGPVSFPDPGAPVFSPWVP